MHISVIINGKRFFGFKDPNVSRALGALSGDFSFSLANFPLDNTKEIVTGQSVEIVIETTGIQHKIITGYINKTKRSFSGEKTELQFVGRDKTSDLVDCAALYKNSQWKKKKLDSICEDICKPYNIYVDSADIDPAPMVEDFALQSGETAFSAIERLCRAFGILPLTDENGSLLLTSIGINNADVRLIVGENIKEIDYEEDDSGRYSDYYFRGQGSGNGSQWKNDVIRLLGKAVDVDITRYRPYLAFGERRMKPTEIARRAAWEAQVRAGRAIRVTITVLGWLQDPMDENSRPWRINELVEIIHNSWEISAQLVVSSVIFNLTEQGGRYTILELNPPEIYKADPGETIELSRRSRVRPS
jgi:prophage tail gpP-like protein